MKKVSTLTAFLVTTALAAFTSGGCELIPIRPEEALSDTVCVLISANTDTYASFGRGGRRGSSPSDGTDSWSRRGVRSR